MPETEHPARRAALLSREYVHSKNREGWLGLYAQDAIIEDPIGVSPIDPEGKGHRGPAAREAFWDNFIAPATIHIDILDSYAAGNEGLILSISHYKGKFELLDNRLRRVACLFIGYCGKLCRKSRKHSGKFRRFSLQSSGLPI